MTRILRRALVIYLGSAVLIGTIHGVVSVILHS